MKTLSVARLLLSLALATAIACSTGASAFAPAVRSSSSPAAVHRRAKAAPTNSALHARQPPAGPVARAKKLFEPEEYNRVVEEKMRQSNISREEAESEYNAFLENPPIYYALEKKEEYYKSLGYKDTFEGMIGEAEKEGRGDEMRERIAKFKLRSKIKAYSVLVVAIVGYLVVRNVYEADPEHFLKGGLPDYSPR